MTRRNAQEGTRMIPGNLHVPEDCRAASEVLGRVGDKWTVLVVSSLVSVRGFLDSRESLVIHCICGDSGETFDVDGQESSEVRSRSLDVTSGVNFTQNQRFEFPYDVV